MIGNNVIVTSSTRSDVFLIIKQSNEQIQQLDEQIQQSNEQIRQSDEQIQQSNKQILEKYAQELEEYTQEQQQQLEKRIKQFKKQMQQISEPQKREEYVQEQLQQTEKRKKQIEKQMQQMKQKSFMDCLYYGEDGKLNKDDGSFIIVIIKAFLTVLAISVIFTYVLINYKIPEMIKDPIHCICSVSWCLTGFCSLIIYSYLEFKKDTNNYIY